MKIIVNQPWGLGDIIFCMTIARRWQAEGHTVIWPVLPHFVDGLRRAYPDIHFTDMNLVHIDYERMDEHDWNGHRVVPLRWNVEILGVPYEQCMASKYSLFEMDYKDWKDNAMWERDREKERDLSVEIGAIKPYKLVNQYYTSDASQNVMIVKPGAIYMRPIPGYSLFDWVGILEDAEEIHAVSSSILYLLELLDLKQPLHLYSRPTDKNFSQVSYLFTKPYILHA